MYIFRRVRYVFNVCEVVEFLVRAYVNLYRARVCGHAAVSVCVEYCVLGVCAIITVVTGRLIVVLRQANCALTDQLPFRDVMLSSLIAVNDISNVHLTICDHITAYDYS